MTVQDKIDTKFLKDTVADVVVKACSACAVARPEDPVGFVAGWLDQFVANDAILKKRAVELTERAAVEAEEEEVRHPEINAHASRHGNPRVASTLASVARDGSDHRRLVPSRPSRRAPRFGISLPSVPPSARERISPLERKLS